MAAWTLAEAKDFLKIWLDCEKSIAQNQAYEINGKSFTKANAAHIRKQVEYWKTEVERLEESQRTGKAPRRGPVMKRVRFLND